MLLHNGEKQCLVNSTCYEAPYFAFLPYPCKFLTLTLEYYLASTRYQVVMKPNLNFRKTQKLFNNKIECKTAGNT